MLNRGAVSEWSVVAVGGLLLAVVLADWSMAAGDPVFATAERILPAMLAAGVVCFGVWLRRRGVPSAEIGTVALGAVAGGALFVLIDMWLFFVISLGESTVPTQLYPTLNLIAIGTASNAALTALYLRLRHKNERLERLTDTLEERNDQLNNQTAKLRAQNERLDQFASLVSHDLRNPLNVAAGRLEMARETADPEHFDVVERSHDRMEALIDETLSLARHGATVEATEATDLSSVAESAWATVATAGLELAVVDDARLEANPVRLQRAFENLFRNAAEHGFASPRSQAHENAAEHGSTDAADASTVRVGVLDDCEGFYVEDDGPGIPADEREAVFEFGRSTDDQGTGLGLAVVRAIVEAHGWSVEATESASGGARFEVTTDAVDALDGREAAPAP